MAKGRFVPYTMGGRLAYQAPEIFDGEFVDRISDQYCFAYGMPSCVWANCRLTSRRKSSCEQPICKRSRSSIRCRRPNRTFSMLAKEAAASVWQLHGVLSGTGAGGSLPQTGDGQTRDSES